LFSRENKYLPHARGRNMMIWIGFPPSENKRKRQRKRNREEAQENL
jgi:hypothetical protein